MIRKTRQRDALIKVIREANRPLSPSEIFEGARAIIPGLGLRTVYRHIKALEVDKQIAGIDYPGQPARYEWVDLRGSRPHIICRHCGKVFDLPVSEPELIYPVLEDFVIEGHEVVYFGHCKTCKIKPESSLEFSLDK